MKTNVFEKINVKETGYRKSDYVFEIKNGNLFFKNEIVTDDTIKYVEDLEEYYSTYKRVLKSYNRGIEKVLDEKRKVESMVVKTFNQNSKDWQELKDLRIKKANTLKDLTIKKLLKLDKDMRQNGFWNWYRIGTVEFYNYGKESGDGDERISLFWGENGYCFKYEEYSGNYEKWIEKEDLQNVTQGIAGIDDMTKKQIKRLAKILPDVVFKIESELYNRIEEIDNLINSLQNISK